MAPEDTPARPPTEDYAWDVFLSHASEDREWVLALRDALTAAGVRVWIDLHEGNWGGEIGGMIDEGLVGSNYAIVVLSPVYLEKYWTGRERSGIAAIEQERGRTTMLPIYHGVDPKRIRRRYPTLAHRLALDSRHDLATIVEAVRGILRDGHAALPPLKTPWWRKRWTRVAAAVAALVLLVFLWTRTPRPDVEIRTDAERRSGGAVVVTFDVAGLPPGADVVVQLDDEAFEAPIPFEQPQRTDPLPARAILDVSSAAAPVTHARVVVTVGRHSIEGPVVAIRP